MKENSIEEELKKLTTGKKMKMYELLRTFKREDIENFVITRKKYVDVILCDYKRVLKENEKYKRLAEMNLKNAEEFKENMCDHRCLLKSENEELKNKLSLKQFDINVVYNDYLEKLNEYKENSISIQKVKDKIEEYKRNLNTTELQVYERTIINSVINVLQELIEEREDK